MHYIILSSTKDICKITYVTKCRFSFKAVFERLVDIICDKMSESLDSDPSLLNSKQGTRLDSAQPANVNCNC